MRSSAASHGSSGSRGIWQLLRIGVICAIGGLMLSCAAQFPPHPPRVERPAPVKDLTAAQVGATVELRFTPPTVATDGEDLTKPLEIEIFRTITPKGVKLSPGIAGKANPPWLILQGKELKQRSAGGKVEYADQLSSADFVHFVGSTFTYGARGFTRGFRGRPIEAEVSNIASLMILDVPTPVTEFAITPTEKALDLSWSAPARTLTGQAAASTLRYHVYRSEAGTASASKPGPYRLIADAHERSYADSSFEFGLFYSYEVRAVVTEDGQSAESANSEARDIVPRDTFPPSPPAGLTGLFTSQAIEVIWNPNLEPDLAGYNIYRRERDGEEKKLNPELLRTPRYRDTAVTAGRQYFYRVSAVDRTGNESSPSPEVEVEVP
jgi:hypothetical protein